MKKVDPPGIERNEADDRLAVGFLSGYFFDAYSLEESILRGQMVARYMCGQKSGSLAPIDQKQLEELSQHFK